MRQHLAALVIDANDSDLRRAGPHGFQHRDHDGLARPGRHVAEDCRAASGRDRAIDAGACNGGAHGAARHGDGGERHRALRSLHAGGYGTLRTGGAKAQPATTEIDGCGDLRSAGDDVVGYDPRPECRGHEATRLHQIGCGWDGRPAARRAEEAEAGLATVKLPRRKFLRLAAGAAALPALSRLARAQTYPTRPMTMVVPYSAGGPTDTIARIMAERMRTSLGQIILVENTTGAAGTIGVGRVARAAPDGYTISIGHWGTHVVNGAIYELQYHVFNDFEPVSLIATNPQLIVARKTIPAKDLKELIAWLRGNAATATQGTAGHGSGSHVSGVYFQSITGTKFQFVPYRGAGPAVQDLVAGQIDMMIDQAANSIPQVRAGTIKAYAVTDKTRLAAAPDIPTVDEAGVPGLHISIWHALWMPKGTPKDIIAKLNGAVVDALADAGVRKRLADLGQEIPPREDQNPQTLAAYHSAEIEKWWPILKAANIKGE